MQNFSALLLLLSILVMSKSQGFYGECEFDHDLINTYRSMSGFGHVTSTVSLDPIEMLIFIPCTNGAWVTDLMSGKSGEARQIVNLTLPREAIRYWSPTHYYMSDYEDIAKICEGTNETPENCLKQCFSDKTAGCNGLDQSTTRMAGYPVNDTYCLTHTCVPSVCKCSEIPVVRLLLESLEVRPLENFLNVRTPFFMITPDNYAYDDYLHNVQPPLVDLDNFTATQEADHLVISCDQCNLNITSYLFSYPVSVIKSLNWTIPRRYNGWNLTLYVVGKDQTVGLQLRPWLSNSRKSVTSKWWFWALILSAVAFSVLVLLLLWRKKRSCLRRKPVMSKRGQNSERYVQLPKGNRMKQSAWEAMSRTSRTAYLLALAITTVSGESCHSGGVIQAHHEECLLSNGQRTCKIKFEAYVEVPYRSCSSLHIADESSNLLGTIDLFYPKDSTIFETEEKYHTSNWAYNYATKSSCSKKCASPPSLKLATGDYGSPYITDYFVGPGGWLHGCWNPTDDTCTGVLHTFRPIGPFFKVMRIASKRHKAHFNASFTPANSEPGWMSTSFDNFFEIPLLGMSIKLDKTPPLQRYFELPGELVGTGSDWFFQQAAPKGKPTADMIGDIQAASLSDLVAPKGDVLVIRKVDTVVNGNTVNVKAPEAFLSKDWYGKIKSTMISNYGSESDRFSMEGENLVLTTATSESIVVKITSNSDFTVSTDVTSTCPVIISTEVQGGCYSCSTGFILKIVAKSDCGAGSVNWRLSGDCREAQGLVLLAAEDSVTILRGYTSTASGSVHLMMWDDEVSAETDVSFDSLVEDTMPFYWNTSLVNSKFDDSASWFKGTKDWVSSAFRTIKDWLKGFSLEDWITSVIIIFVLLVSYKIIFFVVSVLKRIKARKEK